MSILDLLRGPHVNPLMLKPDEILDEIKRLQQICWEAVDEIKRLQELLSDTQALIENERAAHQVSVEMRNQAEAERDRLKSAMRINAIIWNPRLSYDEINSEIERIMRGN
jgi:hypothetical protein